jgi:hypothetical protein
MSNLGYKLNMVLELLSGCGMISRAGSRTSHGYTRRSELSSRKNYSLGTLKPEPFREELRLRPLNR